MMIQSKTIWIDKCNDVDTYAEFIGQFSASEKSPVYINISCDGYFAVYIDEQLAFFGESSDYPWYKMYHRGNLTKYCHNENQLKILVWYEGIDSFKYIKDEPGLFFSIEQEGKVLIESNQNILSRKNLNYKNGYQKSITSQIGLSFFYDSTVINNLPYYPSIVSDKVYDFHLRKSGNVHMGKRVPVNQTKIDGGYIFDFGEEVVGFLELDFMSPEEQKLLISYGEHLVGGQVSRFIGERDFSVEFYAKSGDNVYLNPFRRLAGRYLQVTCKHPIDVTYIGLRSTERRVICHKQEFEDGLLQKIYDVSINTLKKCMHEHYEDCPWREQAMYLLDSRNQMLCGYYAFKGHTYQRENLLFMAKGLRKDGLLSLCFPAGIDIPIPFFSLVYVMMTYDYVKHSGDRKVLREVKPIIDRILDTFQSKIDETGLIPNFPYPCWNFYEWAEFSHNEHEITRTPDEPHIKQYDLILNCMYVYACEIYEKLFEVRGTESNMCLVIHDTFYNVEKALYKLSTSCERYSQLGNSMALLIGLGNKQLADRIRVDKTLIQVTLSMNVFFYDALLKFGDTYKQFIIDDIKEKYGYMLEQGASTFWETEKGWQDFNGAGSLCHGWSAIPVYYLAGSGIVKR